MNQLGVHGLDIKINFVRTYDQLSCVGLDALVEHGVAKLLLSFEQLLLFFSLKSVAGIKHITDVVGTSLGDDRAVPAAEMLVVIQDWICIGIATNASFEIRDTVGCNRRLQQYWNESSTLKECPLSNWKRQQRYDKHQNPVA